MKKVNLNPTFILSLIVGLSLLFTSCSSDDSEKESDDVSVELPITISLAGLEVAENDTSFTAEGYNFTILDNSFVEPSDPLTTSWGDGLWLASGVIVLDVSEIDDISKVTVYLKDNNSFPAISVLNNGSSIIESTDLIVVDENSEYIELDVDGLEFDELVISGGETIIHSIELE